MLQLLFCSCLADSSNQGPGGAPTLSASCITQLGLAKAKGFTKNNFSKCLLLLMFFIMSRVRAESQGFGTYNNHRALGQIKMDKDFHCSGLRSNGLQGCVPLSGLLIVSVQVLKSTPSAPPPPASFLL